MTGEFRRKFLVVECNDVNNDENAVYHEIRLKGRVFYEDQLRAWAEQWRVTTNSPISFAVDAAEERGWSVLEVL